MLNVTGDSAIGTADEDAAARESGTLARSEQMRSKSPCVKPKRDPVEMSVAVTEMNGAGRAIRSAKVLFSNRISS